MPDLIIPSAPYFKGLDNAELIYREGSVSVSSIDVENRDITFIASNEKKDRYGDIVRSEGWELKNFKKNPVLLFSHQSRELPIGKVSKVEVESKSLITVCRFATADVYDFADTVFKLVKAGFLNAVSVGFRPTKMPNDIKDPETNQWTGYEWVGQELLELSVVPVPALASALVVARSLGLTQELIERAMPARGELRAKSVAAFHSARLREIAIAEVGE
jgi:HK97 family phage prohead protease